MQFSKIIKYAIPLFLFGHLASADCSPAASGYLCTSYEFNLPVNILHGTGIGPALTVFGGYVGLGTLVPDKPLTVTGVIRSTTGGIQYPDGYTQATGSRWLSTGTNMWLNNSVGIGTNVPGFAGFANTLTVYSGATRGNIEIASGQADGANVASARIGFYATSNTAGNGTQIGAILTSTEGATALDRGGVIQFYTKANGSFNYERMRINSAGQVGIGTATPVTTLDVNGAMRLARNSSAPYTCSGTYDGAIALTHIYTMCACNGTSWVQTSDGTTACSW